MRHFLDVPPCPAPPYPVASDSSTLGGVVLADAACSRAPLRCCFELQQLVCRYWLTGYAELVGALLKGLLTDRLQVARLVRDHKRAEGVRMRQHVAKFRKAA